MVRSAFEDECNGGSKQDGGNGNKFWNWKEEESDQVGSNNPDKK